MPRSDSFYFPVVPRPKERPRVTRTGHAYTPQKTREHEKMLRDLAAKYKCKPYENAIRVEIVFSFPRPKSVKRRYFTVRPDADNLAKVCDSFNEILWTDDALIVELHATKQYETEEKPVGIYLTITEME